MILFGPKTRYNKSSGKFDDGLMRLVSWLGSCVVCEEQHVLLAIKQIWRSSSLKGRRTLRRGCEREHEGERRLWWRWLRCEIKVREMKSVRRLQWMSSFSRSAVVWSRGKCCKREHAEVPITIKEHMDSLLSPLWLDIERRLKKYVYLFIVNGINVRVGGCWGKLKVV